MHASLQSIYHYPVKSLGGNCTKVAKIYPEGMRHDRRWLITDPNGRFITARQYPQMLLWQAHINDQQHLTLTTPQGEHKTVSTQDCVQTTTVTVWKDRFIAHTAPDAINQWLSEHLKTPCLLHYLGEPSQRPLTGYNDNSKLTFADSAPYLLTTQASLTALNQQLEKPVTMTHFRPNFVIEGDFAPWIEENWRDIRIGGVQFEFLKCCTRCVMINIDPKTGEKSIIYQPFKTLQRIHRERANVNTEDNRTETIFGIQLVAKNSGTISLNSAVYLA